MTKISSYNLIGRQIPFYLNNINLGEQYYLYQICSPSYNENLDPYVAITKISEKTTRPEAPVGKDTDILAVCIGNRRIGKEKGVEFLNDLLKKENPNVVAAEADGAFPMIVLTGSNLVKNLVISLRHANRVKNYRFWGGRYIDVLYTPTEFITLKICENKSQLWFEPAGVYRISDIGMRNPLPIDLSSLEYDKTKFEKSLGVAKFTSDMLFSIKIMEWNSFTRRGRNYPFRNLDVVDKEVLEEVVEEEIENE